MKSFAIILTTLALAAFTLFAQRPDNPGQGTSTNPGKQYDSPNNANRTDVTGTVKTYETGKTLEIDANGKTHKYDLTKTDTTYTISPDVKAGSQVRLIEEKDAHGRMTVTVEPAGKKVG